MADFEAGMGTLLRLEDHSVDVVMVVVEPSAKSIEVGRRLAGLARERGLGRLVVVANRVTDERSLDEVRKAFGEDEVAAVPDDEALAGAERRGAAPLDAAPSAPAVLALAALTGPVLRHRAEAG